MRTTVTLDDDVVASLKDSAHERDVSFKQALNDAVRAGLRGPRQVSGRFVVNAKPMGQRPGVNLDKALQLAAAMEDEEITRKMSLGK